MIRYLTIAIVAYVISLTITGCAVKPIIKENFKTDSVIIREQVRDTVVHFEADSSLIRALVECDSLGNAHIKELLSYKAGKRISPPKIKIEDNILTSTSEIDSLSIYFKLKDRYEKETTTEVRTEIVEVNRITMWQKTWIRIGYISAGIMILFAVIKAKRFF